MERYDIAIIGTGPAGVSAALTAKNRNKSILLLGSRQMSEKVAKAHEIRNYPGLPFIKGEDLAAAFRSQLEQMDLSEDVLKALAATKAELETLPTNGTVVINGELPSEVGEYEVYTVDEHTSKRMVDIEDDWVPW